MIGPLATVALLGALVAPGPTGALSASGGDGGAILPPFFELVPFATDFDFAVELEFSPDGTLFVVERAGIVRVIIDDDLQSSPFMDLSDEVNDHGDRGMLGFALHPGWVPDQGPTSWVYALYTVSPVPGQNMAYNENDQFSFSRLTRWKAKFDGGRILVDLPTREVLLGQQNPDGTVPDGIASLHESHSNGSLIFGTDGSLLVCTGDGAHFDFNDTGGFDDPGFDDFVHPGTGLAGPTPKQEDSGAFRSQDLRSHAGKVLRIDPETGGGYPSNPFYDGDPFSPTSRVWALGLRNPYRAALVPGGATSTDPADAQPGRLLISDVGWSAWEELNLCTAPGQNFEWPCYEGPAEMWDYFTYEAPTPNPYGWPDCTTSNSGTMVGPLLAVHHTLAGDYEPPGILTDAGGTPLSGFVARCLIAGATYQGSSYPAQYIGRHFFADYAQGWIYTARINAAGAMTNVQSFGFDIGDVVSIAEDPATGDLWFAISNPNGSDPIYRLRYAPNLTPIAVASATPQFGDAPLVVSFDGTQSDDPNGDALAYEWDFGDGATANGPTPSHTYWTNGVFDAVLTVRDPFGLESVDTLQIGVGESPPTASIATPAQGTLFQGSATIPYAGTGSDAEDPSPSLVWVVDQYHDSHVHPSFDVETGPGGTLDVEPHGVHDDIVYYRLTLTATDGAGLSGSDHRFVLPSENDTDVTGSGQLIGRLQSLVPPIPQGTGNPDPEVIRDGIFPSAGSGTALDQYDSNHGGDQGIDDWVGLVLPATPIPEFRFYGMTFQEGLHFADGGWFEGFGVEVRDDEGVWSLVDNLHVTPDYPFEDAQTPFMDGEPFEVYELRFDPVWGDAIRLRGTPGGSTGYISVAELRIHALDVPPEDDGLEDVSDEGTIIARLFELDPPTPLGIGNQNPETIRNGTTPLEASATNFAQFDTFHDGDQGNVDWIGYTLPEARTLVGASFQEGKNFPNGGWFDALAVEVQTTLGGAWTPVTGLVSTPSYPGTIGLHYETFELTFDPTVAFGLRIGGDPGGTDGFISVGELRLHALAADCNANGVSDPEEIALGSAPDLDGNGVPDECDPLRADVATISMGAGEAQTFTLDAPDHAGAVYLLVGTLSGAAPGFVLGTVAIPLNPDFYSVHTVSAPNEAPLSGSLGVLDGSGGATAAFSLPLPIASLAGATAHHAFVTLGGSLQLVYASNAVPVLVTL